MLRYWGTNFRLMINVTRGGRVMGVISFGIRALRTCEPITRGYIGTNVRVGTDTSPAWAVGRRWPELVPLRGPRSRAPLVK